MKIVYRLALLVCLLSFVWTEDDVVTDDTTEVDRLDCPVDCSCNNDTDEVDCSNLGLTEIPTEGIPISTKNLCLAGNDITSLPDVWLSPYSILEVLDLSDNSLTSLSDETFSGGSSLYELNLEGNQIDSIGDMTFNYISTLRVLNLKDNKLTEIPSDQIYYISQLKILDIQDNPISEFGSGAFSNQEGLLELAIGGDPAVIGTPAIEKDTFRDLSSLYRLNMTGFDISVLEQGLLSYTPSLTDLYMSSVIATETITSTTLGDVTGVLTLDMSYNTYLPFDSTTLEPLVNLEILILKDASITELPDDFLSSSVNLEFICLDNNRITSLDGVVGESLNLLETLQLSDNDLTDVPTEALALTPSLVSLTLDNNEIVSIFSDAFPDLVSLTSLDLSDNIIESIDEDAFQDLSSTVTLDLSGNSLTTLAGNTLNSMVSLENLNLDDNDLTCDCDMIDLQDWLLDSASDWIQEAVICSSPSSLSGTAVVDVAEESMCTDEEVEIDFKVTVMTGQTVYLPCGSHNDTTVPISWTLPDNSQASIDEDGTLVLMNISSDESGDYICETDYVTYTELLKFTLDITYDSCEHYIAVDISSEGDDIVVDWSNSTVDGIDTYTVTYSEGWPNSSQATTSLVVIGDTFFKLRSTQVSNMIICVTAEHEVCDDTTVHAEYCQEVHGIVDEDPTNTFHQVDDVSRMSTLMIVGLVIVIAFIIVIIVMMLYCSRRQRNKEAVRYQNQSNVNHNNHNNTGNGGVDKKLLDREGGEHDESVV